MADKKKVLPALLPTLPKASCISYNPASSQTILTPEEPMQAHTSPTPCRERALRAVHAASCFLWSSLLALGSLTKLCSQTCSLPKSWTYALVKYWEIQQSLTSQDWQVLETGRESQNLAVFKYFPSYWQQCELQFILLQNEGSRGLLQSSRSSRLGRGQTEIQQKSSPLYKATPFFLLCGNQAYKPSDLLASSPCFECVTI